MHDSVAVAKRGRPALTICSSAFTALGHAQAAALGYPALPIAVIPHPFGSRTRTEVRQFAEGVVADIVRLLCGPAQGITAVGGDSAPSSGHAALIEVPDDLDDLYKFFRERRWGDGLPLVPPTPQRVERMLHHTRRDPGEIIATIAPGYGEATIERVAINAVLAGCDPAYLPVLIAAVEAAAAPQFNLQAVQATTNPAAPWLVVNGPIAQRLQINSGANCLGHGAWANATLGRALRLILQNVGGALPGEMDRATQGQPGKYTFCCAENEASNPWEPLHVERGYARECSTVTVVAAAGTLNVNTHATNAADLLRMIANAMAFAASNDYRTGGEPWIILAPEHARILHDAGMTKADVKSQLWNLSRIAAGQMEPKDFALTQHNRRVELGNLESHTMVPISPTPELIGILVAGGAGTHCVYVPSYGSTRSVTRPVECDATQ